MPAAGLVQSLGTGPCLLSLRNPCLGGLGRGWALQAGREQLEWGRAIDINGINTSESGKLL